MQNLLKKLTFTLCYLPLIVMGQNWQNLGPNRLPTGIPGFWETYCGMSAGNGAFFTIAAEPDNYQNIYASGNNSGVRVSVAGSSSWQDANSGFPVVSSADKIVVDKQKRNGVYSIYASNQWGLYRSDDHGSNWINLSSTFNPQINGTNVFPTYDPADDKFRGLKEYDIAPHVTNTASSTLLGNINWGKYGEENHLLYCDLATGQNINLTASSLHPFYVAGSGVNPYKYSYADIISFPDNATLGTKKFYVRINRYDTYIDANGLERVRLNAASIPIIQQTYLYVLEITSQFTEIWTPIHGNIYGNGHPLLVSSKLLYCDIEVMNTLTCSKYIFAYVSGDDGSEENIMLMSDNNGLNYGNGTSSWQICKGNYNSQDPNVSTKFYPLVKYAISEKLNNSTPQYIYYYWRDGNAGQSFKTDLNGSQSNFTKMGYRKSTCFYSSATQRISGEFHADQRDIEVAGGNNNEAIYISDDGGVAVSYDEGVTFEYLHNNEGLNANHVNGISVSEDGTEIVAGFHHSGTNYYGTINSTTGNWANGVSGDGGGNTN